MYLIGLLLLPQIVLAAPLTGADSDVGVYKYYAMVFYIDDTTDANDSDSSGDVDWTPNADTRPIYIGHLTSKFDKVVFDVSATASMTADLPIMYYNGSSWSNLTLSSQTHPFNSTGVNSISFTPPEDWSTVTVNGTNAYYVRLGNAASNGSGGALSGAQVSQISLHLFSAGGGESVPEFSDILYIVTLAAGGAFLWSQVQKKATI